MLEIHGWGEMQTELNRLSKLGKWEEMGTLITDDILEEFAVVAEPAKVGAKLVERFGGKVDRIFCTMPFSADAERNAFLEELRAG